MTWADGTYYKGGFVNGKTEGAGVRTYPNGDHISGQFKNDKKHGPAVLYKASEDREIPVEYKNDVLVKTQKTHAAPVALLEERAPAPEYFEHRPSTVSKKNVG